MRPLELNLLGQFECSLGDDERVALPTRKIEVLLAYLAMAPGLRHPRERLINLLWSDRGEEQARNSLRQALSALRKALGDSADLILQIDRSTVSVKAELIEIDVHEFERLALEGDYESLATAADLYQGEFLEGVSIRDPACQEWLDGERARFRRQFIEILTNLTETQLFSHDFRHAIHSAERLVKQDPLNESGWRLLMRSYADHGDRSHALQAFKRCRQVLGDELEVEPEAATLELRAQIAGGEPVSRLKPESRPGPAAPAKNQNDAEHSIAVLPFDNLSGDPEQEYFSDGITESIILNLSLFPGLNVKSRNASFAFKQQIKSLGEISQELGVDYIVEGSIRKSAERVRATVQLIEAASGDQIWGKRYDAEIEDLLDLEENLSRSIAATVTGQIESELQRIALTKGASDQQAYDLLLSGIYHRNLATKEGFAIAIDQLNRCLSLDPDNVRAHATLCGCHLMNWMDRLIEDYEPSFELAGKHAKKALELGPENVAALGTNGDYQIFCRNYKRADEYFDKALAINPHDPDSTTAKVMNLSMQGRFEEALDAAQKTLELDPYNWWIGWNMAEAQYLCGHYENALETIAQSKNAPSFIRIYSTAAYVKLGNMPEARKALKTYLRECRESMAAMPQTREEWLQYTCDTAPFQDPAINREILDCLLQAGLEEELTPQSATSDDDLPSILVLPFSNLSGDPEQEYFSDGITDSIIVSLSSFSGIQVKSRHTSIAFRDSSKSIEEIGAELGVQYIVEGSVRKLGDNLRITVQLGDTASGNQIWGKRYDSQLEDLFALEEELVQTVAGAISARIDRALRATSVQKPARDLKSYDYLMRGWHHAERFNPEDYALSIEYLKKCVELDPDNGQAHAALAAVINLLLYENWSTDREATRREVDYHVNRALEIDRSDALAHAFMSEHQMLQHNLEKALYHAEQAIKNNPALPDGYSAKAMVLSYRRRHDEAVKLAEFSLQMDPYHFYMAWNASIVFRHAGEYQKSVEAFRSLAYPSPGIHAEIAASLVALGEFEEAREEMSKFKTLAREQMPVYPASVEAWRRFWQDVSAYEFEEDFEAFFDMMQKAGLCDDLSESANALPSILVLPLENMSRDPEQEYFSDGITESVIMKLGSFGGLEVKSRHASFAYKDSPKTIEEIAAESNATYIVEGSVRKLGERLRITVGLGDVAGGKQLWGKRYDSDLIDLFALEEELSQTIAGTVINRVDKEARQVSLRKPASDLKSYDYFMRGCYHLELFTGSNINIAIEQLEKCIALDPDNALAHARLGVAYMMALYENCAADREHATTQMDRHFSRALELDPDDAEAHAFMAERLLYIKEFDRALVHARKALELNPAMADGYSMLAWHAGATRQIDTALEYADKSMQIDIHHPYAGWNAGEIYRLSGNYEKAIETFRSMAHMSNSVRAQVAACLAGLDRIDEAREEIRRYLDFAREQMVSVPTSREQWYDFWYETMPYQYREDSDDFFALLEKAGLCDDLQQKPNEPPSIAVLPFENMSGDPEQEYFSDGITASIILSLGLYKGLNVKSQNSSFAFKNSGKSSEEIAEELGVAYLIEGSIRKSTDKVRITVQLIEADSGNQVWGKQYDAELENILDLEQEMSQTIAATISGRIGHRIQESAARKPANNLKSYDYFLRGMYHFGRFSAEDLAIAVDQFEKCIAIDPKHAEAHLNLGMVHEIMCYENWTADRSHSGELCDHHLSIALELAPDNAQVHAYLSERLVNTRDTEGADFHADRAIELNPNSSEAYIAKAQVMLLMQRNDEAREFAERGVQLDPFSTGAAWVAGEVYLVCGEYDRSLRAFRSIENPPNTVHAEMAAALQGLGKPDQARREMARFLENARKDMPKFPASTEAWRKIWHEYTSFQAGENFEVFFGLLLETGLCDEPGVAATEAPSIAVLPFENMSGDPEQEHFSDGITADIIDTLSKFPHLRTISRYSTLQYKSERPAIADIAAQQQVRYILEGSVRKSGNRIRVSAALIDSKTEAHCWSERYDRELDDLFAVQDEITRQIALAMKMQLDDGEQVLHRSRGATSIKAWELTLAAVDLQETYIRQNILEAREKTLEATCLDPDYAYAWITLGWTYWQEAYSGWSDAIEDLIAEADKANQHAMKLEPEYGEAWIQAGMNHQMKHEPEAAISACLKAIELEPGSAEAHALTAFAYLADGDHEEARKYEQNMRKLCPILPNWYFLVSGGIEKQSGNLDLAIDFIQQGLDVEPDSPLCRFYLIDALMDKGDEARARQLADEIKALDKAVTGKGLVHACSYDAGERQRFHDNLAKFGLV